LPHYRPLHPANATATSYGTKPPHSQSFRSWTSALHITATAGSARDCGDLLFPSVCYEAVSFLRFSGILRIHHCTEERIEQRI